MTENYEIFITLYTDDSMIQYVTDNDGDIYKINHDERTFEPVLEHAFILDLEDEISKAVFVELRNDADKKALLDMLDYSAAEKLTAILRA